VTDEAQDVLIGANGRCHAAVKAGGLALFPKSNVEFHYMI
jgi:hypothetical protein